MKNKVICPYCNKEATKVHSSEIYGHGHNYGAMYLCKSCDAYVGCHKGTSVPLGTLANKATREARKKAHAEFDPIWKSRKVTRRVAYNILATALGKSVIHIGESDVETCNKIINVSNEIKRKLKL